MAEPRIAILASGNGSTAETVIRTSAQNEVNFSVDLVISSRRKAGIVERVTQLNSELNLAIDLQVINPKTHPAADDEAVYYGAQTRAEEQAILDTLTVGNFELIVLLGYMKKVGPKLVSAFGWHPDYSSVYQARMVNTHPGLLPTTKGLHGSDIQQYVLEHKLPMAGQSFHVVANDYDTGPVIIEHQVPVAADDSVDSLFARVQTTEKQNIAQDIENFITERQKYLANQV